MFYLAPSWPGTGALSIRRAVVLIGQLPSTSRLSVAVRGSEHDGWDLTAHLLAALIDATNVTPQAVAQVNSKRKLARPEPVPRPDTQSKPKAWQMTVAQWAARSRNTERTS